MLKTEYRPVGGPVMAEAIVPATAACAPLAGDWRRTQLPLLTGLPLLPIGTSNGKAPVDPATGAGLRSWQTAAWDPATIAATDPALVTAVGLRCGPDAGGLLAFDVDGESALRVLEAAGCEPYKGGWVLSRPSATDRLKVVWRVPPDLWPSAGDRRAGKVVLATGEGEQLEAFFGSGQIVVAGLHRQSGDLIDWHETGPDQVRDLPPAWHALWQRMGECAPETTGVRKARAETCRGEWRTPSICPICGRNDPGDCQQSRDGAAVLCHHGKRWQPPAGLRMGETVERSGSRWAFCGDYANAIGSAALFRVHRPRSLQQEAPQAAPAVDQASTPATPQAPTFSDRWAALEAHADAVSREAWPLMKAVASLASEAADLEIPRLTSHNLEQLLEAASRRQRPTAAPLTPGASFAIRATPWAVDGVFRHGVNLLVGQPGAGKSRLSAAAVAAWLRGDRTWLGREMPCDLPPDQRHALIIGTDQPLEDWALTLEPVGLVERLSAGEVQLHPRLTLHALETGTVLDPDGLATIRRWCDAHPHGVVLVDSLAACLPPGIDEDKAAVARPVHALTEAIGSCWCLLTHHSRKAAGKDQNLGVGAGRGSSAIDGAVSRVIGLGLIHKMENGVLTPQEADPRRELLSTKRGGATLHLVIRSDADGHWSNEGSAEDLKRQERRERTLANLTDTQAAVLSALDDATGWLTGRQVAEALLEPGEAYDARGSHAATTRKVLKRLEAIGLVETQRTGLDRLYRAMGHGGEADGESQESQLARVKIDKSGSNGSNAAAQGISAAHPVAHTGSEWLTPDPAALGGVERCEPEGEPEGEPVRATCEPEGEPAKPLAAQRVSQESHPPYSPGSKPLALPAPEVIDRLLSIWLQRPCEAPATLALRLDPDHRLGVTGRKVKAWLAHPTVTARRDQLQAGSDGAAPVG